MSFDPISFAMGRTSGSDYDAGYAEGYTHGVADGEADLLSLGNNGMVVWDGALTVQQGLTITENGTYDTTLISTVDVDVPTAPGPHLDVLSGTVSDPWDFIDVSGLPPAAKLVLHAGSLFRITVDVSALQMGFTEIGLMLTPNTAGNFIFSSLMWVDNTDYQMAVAEYDELDGGLVTFQALMNGQWKDLTAYAGACTTTAHVISLID